MENIIEIKDLFKKFGDLTAVNDVSLNIKKGEIFGLLGPNGAGKSTTINMILGLLKPTSGKIVVNGTDMHKNPEKVKNEIGIVTQETVVEPELTGEQNLMIFGMLYHIPKSELQRGHRLCVGACRPDRFQERVRRHILWRNEKKA